MSADNCIGILRTITKDGKHEWRVSNHHMVWADDFEKVKVDIQDKLSFLSCYRNAPIFLTKEEAEQAAEDLEDGSICEYGIEEYELNMVYPDDSVFVLYSKLLGKCTDFGNKTQKWQEAYTELRQNLTRIMPQYA